MQADSKLSGQREAWVDAAKGIGIILVVLGHALRGLQKSGAGVPGSMGLDAWIYAFHMPLFFFLAGLFLERSVTQPARVFLDGRMRRILWPYIVWSLLQETFRHIARNPDALPFGDFWTIVYKPVMQFWFLYVLFLLLVLYMVLRKAGMGWGMFVILAFCLNLSMDFGVSYGNWGVVYQMWTNIPYLALGVLFTQCGGFERVHTARSRTMWGIFPAGFLLVAWAMWLPKWAIALLGVPVAVAGIAASCAVAVLAVRMPARWGAWLGTLGFYSLEIFVAHTIFSSAARQVLLACGVVSPLIQLAAGISVGLGCPLVLVLIFHRLRCEWLFALPGRRVSR